MLSHVPYKFISKPRREKTCFRSFRRGQTETGAQKMVMLGILDYTFYVAKKKTLISCSVTAQLICAFVFAYAKKQVLS